MQRVKDERDESLSILNEDLNRVKLDYQVHFTLTHTHIYTYTLVNMMNARTLMEIDNHAIPWIQFVWVAFIVYMLPIKCFVFVLGCTGQSEGRLGPGEGGEGERDEGVEGGHEAVERGEGQNTTGVQERTAECKC